MIQINYKVIGEGKPIYFIHGNTLSMVSMIEVYEEIFNYNSGYQRIYIDLPGMGESVADYDIDSSDKMVNMLVDVANQLTPDDKIIVVGHSYGGYLCLGLQHMLKDRVSKLFLTCPVVIAVGEERTLPKHTHILLDDVAEDSETFKEYLTSTVKISHDSWAMYQTIIDPGFKVYDKKYNEFLMRENREYYRLSFEQELMQSKVETSLVLGRNDDVVGYQDQWALFSENEQASIYLLSQTGHNVMLDEPEFIKERLAHLLDIVL